jgi:uncharacterized protein YbjT (DUF2867 family)
MSKSVLVLGGSGHYGRHIVRHLVDRGAPVRVLSRNPQNAARLLGEQVEILSGDITSREDVRASLAGVDRLVISVSAFSARLISRLKEIERDAVLEVLQQAHTQGVNRVVYLSVYDIRSEIVDRAGDKYQTAKIKREIESALTRSDFNWTVLGMPPSMELFFALIRGEVMTVPGGGPPSIPSISPMDAGAIGAQTALRTDLHGKRIRMAGPQVLSFPEAARRISAATGKRVRFRAIPLVPLRLAAFITAPFYPYLKHLVAHLELLNNFPQDLAKAAVADHQFLLDTFDFTPTTIEIEASLRMGNKG